MFLSFLTGKDSFKLEKDNRNWIDSDNKIKPFSIQNIEVQVRYTSSELQACYFSVSPTKLIE